MKTRIISIVGAAIISFLSGCVSGPTALKPVGPDAANSAEPTVQGHLRIYTATQVAEDFIQGSYLQATGYEIKDAAGKHIAFVPDQDFGTDGLPKQLTLPAGSYNIVAESAEYGLVTVPVAIGSGKTATLHLDENSLTPSPVAPIQPSRLSERETNGWNDASGS